MLDVVELTKHYGRTVALDRVSLHVDRGELFGLLGPNGAGKSTLLSIASGLAWATGGEVTLRSRPLTPDTPDVRRQLGLVPQDLAIYPDLSARENLAFFGQLYDLSGPPLRKRVDEVLTAVGLADRADHRVATFSGGMKRRLNLAAALVHSPEVLYLDEPTVGVDPQSRNRIFEEVRRLNKAGTTVVYTSHYMEEVQSLCPRVGILDHGRLVACDTVSRLLKTLDAVIRFRPEPNVPALRARLIDAGAVPADENGTVELHTRDVPGKLQQVLGTLLDHGATAADLEVLEPNLERVFLHLTGHGLRD